MRRALVAALASLAVLSPSLSAAPLSREDVPAPLSPWASWVLRGHEAALCPFFHGQDRRDCAWPGLLKLSLEESGGTFEQGWTVHAESWVPLPGGAEAWPLGVRVDGVPAPVVRRGETPSVRLKPGARAVSGTFRWRRLPEQLQIPPETGLLALTSRGAAAAFPPRDEAGRLWLAPRKERPAEKEESHLEVSVHRRLVDEIPLQLLTRIQLKVSGAGREAVLGKALPEGFSPMSLVSPLPARLEPDGRLRVQARAGTWDLTLAARQDERGAPVALSAKPGGPWDEDEAWVFESRPALRQAELEGAPSLDPQQTELPEDWKGFPAYLVRPGASLKISERQRGDEPPPPDRLSVTRELWLDFDGGGFSARDWITGTLGRSWRLEAAPESKLGRVAINGVDQFLTSLTPGGPAGLELRNRQVSLMADSRFEGGALPATGWAHDFESVSASLHLPPGWTLAHARGVDQARPTWVTRWTLLDLFVVLIAAAAAARLWGPRWGAAMLVALALSWHEREAPQWLWLWAVTACALERALSENEKFGRMALGFRRLVWVVLLLTAVPFLIRQARVALYPVLEHPGLSVQPRQAGQADLPAPAPAPEELSFGGGAKAARMSLRGMAKQAAVSSLSYADQVEDLDYKRQEAIQQLRLDPKAQVTTGPGLPYWNWNSVSLTWKGPVPEGHSVGLWLIPPRANALLSLVRIALAGLLLLLLAGLPVGDWLDSLRGPDGRSRLAKALLPLLLLALPASARAQAAFPSRELLDELRGRLLERPDCAPICAESPAARLTATPSFLSISLDVHAAAPTAIPLPSGGREWTPARALLGGAPARVRRAEDGGLWLPLPAGSHQVTLDGPLPDRDSVQIALPLRPRRIESSVSGWSLHGVREDGRADAALQLSRSRATPGPAAEARAQGLFPALLQVERTLRLGLSWTVETRITRLTPGGSPVSAQIPLLPGESITSADVRVSGGKASVSLGPQAFSAAWNSILKEAPTLALAAPKTSLWTETWRIEPGPLWNVKTQGIPRILDDSGQARAHVFRPWPGEGVELTIRRPLAVAGQTLTVDQSVLVLSPGLRATDAALSLSLRSSRGGQHALTLPEGASLLSAKIDGADQPLRLEDRKLNLPIRPGAHAVEVSWRQPGGASARLAAPEVHLGAASVNAHIHVAMPAGRWTLLLGGPGVGPAVVFWSLLGVFFILSGALAKSGLAPLTWGQWFTLSLGMTQISVPSAAIVVLWFVALTARERGPRENKGEFNLGQLFLAGLTLAAAACLFQAISRGLLGHPDMQIEGNGSTAELLRWYIDRSGETLPRPWVLSAPLWVYRLAMLAWALWLADSMVRWARWAWGCFTAGGAWK